MDSIKLMYLWLCHGISTDKSIHFASFRHYHICHRRIQRGQTMAAYWIAHVAVSDAEVYGEYAKRATEAIAAHGGEFLARATRTIWLEGKERERNVVVRFDSVEDAERCYHSPAYQEALQFAKASAERDLCIIAGN
jgi:uncharacterized protein (DUF1330 family)